MSDLRALFEDVVARRVIPAAPAADIVRRAEGLRTKAARRQAATLVAAGLLLASSITWARWGHDETSRVVAQPGGPRPTTSTGPSAPAPAPSAAAEDRRPPAQADGTVAATGAPPPSDPPPWADADGKRPECKPGANGGETDVGVRANRIHLGMTNTRSGTDSSVLGEAYVAAQAVVHAVNRTGGICGRLLELRVLDDPDGPDRWPRFGGMFAELVGPLQPGFDAHLAAGTVDREGVPAVGTDGFSTLQFRSPWVWPVGTPAASSVRIAVDHAYRSLGARTFALVHDDLLDFEDAAPALRAYVATLPGASVRTVQRVDGNRGPQAGTVEEFNGACGDDACDVVLLAMATGTTREWLARPAARGKLQTAILRFLPGLGNPCSSGHKSALAGPCPTVDVWSAYTPPIEAFRSDPDVAEYEEEVRAVHDGVDTLNPFVQGTYVGVQVLVEALKRVGPVLTQDRLRTALDSMRFESGLVGGLAWGPEVPGQRAGNRSARLLRIGDGLDDAGTGWVHDPTPGAFPP